MPFGAPTMKINKPWHGVFWLLLSLCFTAALPKAILAETRQHGRHEHGSAELNIAVAEQTLMVEYTTPVANILGFEHAAKTEKEKQALHEAEEVLKSDRIISLPTDADCTLAHTAMQQEEEHEEHEAEHEEHEEHEEHVDDGPTHSEFHVVQEYRCGKIAALTYMDVNLFELFPGNEEITVQIVSPAGQKGMELTPSNARLMLP